MLTLALARQSSLDWPPTLQWLAPGERARLASCGSPARRRQFLAGRWCLRAVLGQDSVDVDGQGRSMCPQGHANLSHSGAWILAGVSDGPLGVDLEVLRPRKDLPGLARLVLDATQCRQLQHLSGDLALTAFYRGWTLREAWFKARGQGLDLEQSRELDFVADAARPCDSACALIAPLGLVVSIHQPQGLDRLPDTLAGQPLCWHYLASRAPR